MRDYSKPVDSDRNWYTAEQMHLVLWVKHLRDCQAGTSSVGCFDCVRHCGTPGSGLARAESISESRSIAAKM
jgi:hypothetical protein